MVRPARLAAGFVTTATLITAAVFAQSLQYPFARKMDHVDRYHGVVVPDPYRWLEDDNSPETAAWVAAQNTITFPYLEGIPFRQHFQRRVQELNKFEKILGSVAQGALLLLQSERRAPESERALHPEGVRRHA
jgi:prolyl oligopeptidase